MASVYGFIGFGLIGGTVAKAIRAAEPDCRICASIVSAGVLVAIVTAYCGPISFLGLAVPHLCRGIFRTSDHRILMPATLLAGAALALLCNLIARMPGFEGALPVNSVTALIGAPVVAVVLFRRRKEDMGE